MITLGRSPSGQEYADLMLRQNKILGNMLGADIDFVVRGIDSKTRSVVASRREAMMRKRQISSTLLWTSMACTVVYEGRHRAGPCDRCGRESHPRGSVRR